MFLFEFNWAFGSEVMTSLSEAAWKFEYCWYTVMCKTAHSASLNKFLKKKKNLVKIIVTFDQLH